VQRAAAVARPGTLVHVAPGRYRPVDSSRSGTKAAPIVFWSESPWQAKVEGRGAVTAWDNTGDWVVVDGFDISGSTYNGILSTGSHGRFRGNHVHDLRGPNCTRGGAGIVMETYTAVDNDTTGNVVERIIAPGNCARVHGIYYQSADGGRILNNVVATCSGWGIHLWHDARRIRISNNTVVGNAHGGIAVGGSLEGNDLLPGIASGVIVTNNLVTENGQAGIIEIGRVGRNTFAANLSTNNSGADYSLGNGHRPVSLVRGEPDFVDPVRDYHLRPGSAALDAGIRQGAPAADLDGARRPQGAGVDIGAYEGAR
jgi:parallel beta-helix repeat protein